MVYDIIFTAPNNHLNFKRLLGYIWYGKVGGRCPGLRKHELRTKTLGQTHVFWVSTRGVFRGNIGTIFPSVLARHTECITALLISIHRLSVNEGINNDTAKPQRLFYYEIACSGDNYE